jgi:hypothetical protein
MMSLTPANFTRETFAALLRSESLRCILVAVERRWLAPVPDAVVYYYPTVDHRRAFSEDHTEVVVPGDVAHRAGTAPAPVPGGGRILPVGDRTLSVRGHRPGDRDRSVAPRPRLDGQGPHRQARIPARAVPTARTGEAVLVSGGRSDADGVSTKAANGESVHRVSGGQAEPGSVFSRTKRWAVPTLQN